MTESTQTSRLNLLGMLAIPILLLTPGCETDKAWWREKPEVAVSPPPTVPPTFLYTDYEPLRNWMDERFEVEYRNMTPTLIFDQLPINDINYDTVNLPPDSEKFELKSPNISRREILYKASRFWELTMSVVEQDGIPTSVKVVGRGNLITNEANIPSD